MLRQDHFRECTFQVLDVRFHATLNSSRNSIVDNGIMSKQTSIYTPFTIVHCVAVPRQHILDFNAVRDLLACQSHAHDSTPVAGAIACYRGRIPALF
ncbi:MAG TPA: hypothetical protein VGI45_24300 [Terracidiphilus sp.]